MSIKQKKKGEIHVLCNNFFINLNHFILIMKAPIYDVQFINDTSVDFNLSQLNAVTCL